VAFQYDPKQPFQIDAISAVCHALEGQPSGGGLESDSGVIAVANGLELRKEEVLRNVRNVQGGFRLPLSDSLDEPLRLSVEMETGTGKTYVYLRTIQELRREYGLTKFVIVAPTVAIREAIAAHYRSSLKHFETLYGPELGRFRIYDSSSFSLIREFSVSDGLEVLLLGLNSFNKTTNLIYAEVEELDYAQPMNLLSACRPVVILDEPQNMGGEAGKRAILALNPLMVLGYSATHRKVVNLVYRLGPVKAHELGIVKRIDVLSVVTDRAQSAPIELVSLKPDVRTLRAKCGQVRIRDRSGAVKTVSYKLHDDFVALSGGRAEYGGFVVTRVEPARGIVHFANGVSLSVGEQHGTDQKEMQRLQIRATIQEHLERELHHLRAGLEMKVLSIFFIDVVKRYVAADGEIREWFEQSYAELASEPRFAGLDLPPVDQVHRGYFSKKRGQEVDTTGSAEEDKQTYVLIMQDKEGLLDPHRPLRFIFSHSALREGWDNPNVFQICTLNLTKSDIKKRQEIGRGLRLPVNPDGSRCMDPNIARLTVIANESYEEFAKDLQQEFKDDCGVEFKGTSNRRDLVFVQLRDNWMGQPELVAAWNAIAPRTSYRIDIDTDQLIAAAIEDLGSSELSMTDRVTLWKAALNVSMEGVVPAVTSISAVTLGKSADGGNLTAVISALHARTGLTRHTLSQILHGCGKHDEIVGSWNSCGDAVAGLIKKTLARVAQDKIEYQTVGDAIPMSVLETPTRVDRTKSLSVSKSIYDRVPYQSDVEKDFAIGLEARTDVLFFLKLPVSFKILTLVGPHTPDWVIVQRGKDGDLHTVVVETKGDVDDINLREVESIKIRCAKAHFAAVGVRYYVLADITQLPPA
jgi:type III restriction enzyme